MRRLTCLLCAVALLSCGPERRIAGPPVEPPQPAAPPAKPQDPPVEPSAPAFRIEDMRDTDPTPILRIENRSKVLFDFEDIREFRAWEAAPDVRIVPGRGPAGSRDMQVRVAPGQGYGGIEMAAPRGRFLDWSGHAWLEFDAFNPSDLPFNLLIRADDDRSYSYPTRFDARIGLVPGRRSYSLRLKQAKTVDGKRLLDWARLKKFVFFVSRRKDTVSFSIDNLRLAGEPAVSRLEPRIHLFDFGGKDHVWPGFTAVTSDAIWDDAKGYGFTTAQEVRREVPDSYPDALAGDFIAPSTTKGGAVSFGLNVPNGRYAVVLYGQNSHTEGYPARSWAISAEGREVLSFEMTPERFYSKEFFYRGIDDAYEPGADLWAKYVQPRTPRHGFMVDVRDGRLDLRLRQFAVAALIVCPEGLLPRVRHFMKQIEQQRREQFYANLCTVRQGKFSGWPADLPEADRARGFVVFGHDYLQPVTPELAPREEDLNPTLAAAACPGETEPVAFCVRPLAALRDVRVTVSDLAAGDSVIPASAVDVRIVRHVLVSRSAGVYEPLGRILDPARPMNLPADVTQGYWLTVRIPDSAAPGGYSGTVRITAADRPAASVPIVVTVYPFLLGTVQELSLGLYYKGPFTNNYRYAMFPGMTEEAWRTVEREILDQQAHGLNTIQFPEPALSLSGGRVHLDFSAPDRFADLCRKHGMCSRQPGMMFTINVANYLMRRGHAEFSPSFNELYKQAIGQITAWAERKGIAMVIWPVDEPRERLINPWNRDFAGTVGHLKLLNELPDAKSTVTVMADKQSGVDYVPMVQHMDIVQTKGDDASAGIVAACRAQRKPMWIFNAGYGRASWGFLLWAMPAQGRWQWHYQWWDKPVPYSPFNSGVSGMSYPAPEGPRPTVQYELLREGIDDYRYLKRLEAAIEAARAAGRDTAPAAKLLDSIRAQLPKYAPQADEFNRILDDRLGDAMPRRRRDIARQIIQLEAK